MKKCNLRSCGPFFFPLLTACFLTLFLSHPLYGSGQRELEPFLKTIQAASDQVRSFSSKFIQEKHLAIFTDPVIFHGRLTVVRPDQLRWEFSEPVRTVLIFNGDQGIRCTDKGPPVEFDLGSDPVMRTVAEQLWLWMGGDYDRLSQLYMMQKEGPASLVIRPQDASVNEFIEAVTISFDEENWQPKEVKISETGGDVTLIRFHSYTLNGDMVENFFSRCDVNE